MTDELQELLDALEPFAFGRSLETMVGRKVSVTSTTSPTPKFNAAVANEGLTPMLGWQVQDGSLADPVNQPAYTWPT